jgi:transposase
MRASKDDTRPWPILRDAMLRMVPHDGRVRRSLTPLRHDLVNLRQQLPPRLVHLRRPVGSENFAQRIGDHAEKLAEQLSRRAVGVVRLHLAWDQAKVPGAVAGEIQDGVDGQRQH